MKPFNPRGQQGWRRDRQDKINVLNNDWDWVPHAGDWRNNRDVEDYPRRRS